MSVVVTMVFTCDVCGCQKPGRPEGQLPPTPEGWITVHVTDPREPNNHVCGDCAAATVTLRQTVSFPDGKTGVPPLRSILSRLGLLR